MLRSFVLLVGGLFVVGCAESLPPEPPPPPPPIAVEDGPRVVDEGLLDPPRSDEATLKSALRVFASEQRTLLGTLEDQARLVRASTSSQSRLRLVLGESDRELTSIERELARLDDDSLVWRDRGVLHDELKDRLRRLASRLSLIERAIREK